MTDALSLFRLIDAQDLEGVGELFSPDARFVMGNSEPLEGREAIVAGNKAFFSQLRGIRHHLRNEWTVEADTIAETDVTYLRLDGREVTIPGVAIWQVDEDGLIADLRVFADHAAVFAR